MKFKRIAALALAIMMVLSLLFAFYPANVKAEVAKADWTVFDALIKEIKTTTDFVAREALMHKAEDMLMETGALCPLYHYNDIYMAKPELKDFHTNLYGFKFFMFSTYGDKDTLRLCLASEPDRLDPALNSSVDGACLAVNSFAGLMTYDKEGQVVPDCAEKFEVSEDQLTYTFTMKPDLKWSDGDVLTAKDFEYAWKRAVSAETAADYSYMFDSIAGYPDNLEVLASEDGTTLTVKLHAPCAYFLDLCAFPAYFPVKQAAVEAAAGYKNDKGEVENPGAWALEAGFPSNGAYVLKEWKHKESMVYEKNPNYHRADEVKLSKLEFMLSDDDAVIYSAYQAGDVDFIDGIPTDEVTGLLEESHPQHAEFYCIPQLGTYYVCFNVKSNLFDGKTVEEANAMRRALAYIIDRDYIVETVTKTGQILANTFIPVGMADGHGGVFKANDADFTYPDEADMGYFPLTPDLAKAQELLESAGYKFVDGKLSDETPLHINYLYNKSDAHQQIAECIQQDLTQLGISMTLSQCDWKTFLRERKAGHYDVARNGWIADFNDPINMLEMWSTDSGNNDVQFGR